MNGPAAASAEVVSKGRYAALKNVTPGRVSQWISEGKIGPEALDGEGRSARIKVGIADAQLRRRLDISQRLGNGLSTRLSAPSEAMPAAQPQLDVAAPTAAPVAAGDPVEERIKQERLEQLQRSNRRAAEEEAARTGCYTDSDAAKAQMARIASQMLSVIEGSLGELATAISSKFSAPQRDVLHLLRAEFRSVRLRAAASARQTASDLPAFVDDDEEEQVPLAAE